MTVPVEVGPAIIKVLRDNAALVALLGSYGGQPTIYSRRLPQGAPMPAILVTHLAGLPVSTMGSDPGLVSSFWSLSIMAADTATKDAATVALLVTRALKQALVRYKGTVTTTGDAGGSVTVQAVLQRSERDDDWPDLARVGKTLDVEVWAS